MNDFHEKLGAWLKLAIPAATDNNRTERIVVIQNFVTNVTISETLPLVLMFFDAARQGTVPDRLRSILTKDVTSFSPQNDAEVAIIAGGALFKIFDIGGVRASATALALGSAEFGGLRGAPRVQDVVDRAVQYLVSESLRIREEEMVLPDFGKSLTALLNATGAKANEDEEEHPDDEETDEETGRTMNEDAPELEQVVQVLSEYCSALNRIVRIIDDRRREEANILYWLLSGRRRIGDQPFSELKRQDAALHIACDLAEQTVQIPGPVAAPVILRTLLEQCKDKAKESSVNECISRVSAGDGAHFLSSLKSYDPRLMPLAFALEKAQENGWRNGWQTAFETQTTMKASAGRTYLEFAEQFYRELLLARLLTRG